MVLAGNRLRRRMLVGVFDQPPVPRMAAWPMNARDRRKAARWARYFNHYAHIPGVALGGRAAYRIIFYGMRSRQDPFLWIRWQAKHR